MKKTPEEIEKLAQSNAVEVWGEYHDNTYDESCNIHTYGEISAKDFIAGYTQCQQDNEERKYAEAEFLNALHSAELLYNENYSKIWEHVKLKLISLNK